MRHFVQMSCCAQFPRWLAGYSVCVTIAAQIGKAPMKNATIAPKTQNRDRTPHIWKQSGKV
jgi:hypothetical protein